MKRMTVLLLVMGMLLTMLPLSAFAENEADNSSAAKEIAVDGSSVVVEAEATDSSTEAENEEETSVAETEKEAESCSAAAEKKVDSGVAAENNTEGSIAVAEREATESAVPKRWGAIAYIGETDATSYLVYVGTLLYYINHAEPSTVDTGVIWVIQRDGIFYYAKITGNSTEIYKRDAENDADFTLLTRISVPAECFDMQGNEVYYLWNGAIKKVNVETGAESFVQEFDGEAFWMTADRIVGIENTIQSSSNIKRYLFESPYLQQLRQGSASNKQFCTLCGVALLVGLLGIR